MSVSIPVEDYLRYALNLKSEEIAIRERVMAYLPDTIIDCHAHCNLAEHVIEIEESIYSHMMSTFPYFSLEDSYHVKEVLYPGKTVHTLRFANAYKGIDHKAANDYLIERSRPNDRVALYGIPTDIAYTNSMLHHPRIVALKMYPAFFIPRAEKIYQYFPEEVLEEAQSCEIPIILHLPRIITDCTDELRKLITDFPKLLIVLAHLGLPHLPVPNLFETYKYFSTHENLFMDTAMIPSKEVVGLAIQAFGASRIMFGSDEPLNLVRSKVYHNPSLGQRLATEYLYHWVNPDEHKLVSHLAHRLVHTQWQALDAAIEAVKEILPNTERGNGLEEIFYKNAKAIYRF